LTPSTSGAERESRNEITVAPRFAPVLAKRARELRILGPAALAFLELVDAAGEKE
jgi:hypothetical protein